MESIRLFVYGSLKRGFRHHEELGEAELLGPVQTALGYRLVLYGEYPALVRAPGAPGTVSGELYQLPRGRLPELDAFEDCPVLYQREVISLADGSLAQAYLIPVERAQGLPGIAGDRWGESKPTRSTS